MCFILNTYTTKNPTTHPDPVTDKIIDALAYSLSYKQESNPHGFGMAAAAQDKQSIVQFRTMAYNESAYRTALQTSSAVHTHLRFATMGEVSDQNVHYWKHGAWYFAHNGFVSGYRQTNVQKEHEKGAAADSLLLFKDLIAAGLLTKHGNTRNLDWKRITEIAEDKLFNGRFTLINEREQIAYYFGDFDSTLIENRVLAISSAPLTLYEPRSFFGIDYGYEASSFELVTKELNGIFAIAYGEQKFYQIQNELSNQSIYSSKGKKHNKRENNWWDKPKGKWINNKWVPDRADGEFDADGGYRLIPAKTGVDEHGKMQQVSRSLHLKDCEPVSEDEASTIAER